MPGKTLLYVSARQASAVRWRAGRLAWCREFTNDQDGWAEFSSLLLSHPGTPVYLLVDAVEEDYRNEILPHAAGAARREMLARKLRQFYRATPYRAVWPQGRDADKRRDDRYLFTALTNPELLRPWLEIVQTRRAPLAGIFLLPMVSQQLLGSLQVRASKLLLVSQHSGGLRQSFFQDMKLKISRLTPLEVPGSQTMTTYAEEIEKTRFYLNSLRLTTREERLAVCVLDPSGTLGELCRVLAADPGLQCLPIDHATANSRLGLTTAILAGCPNAFHLAALGARPPDISLAPAALTRGFLHYRVRLALYGLGAAAALAGAIWGGANLYLAGAYRQQSSLLAARTRQQDALYLTAARHFPDAPTSAERLLKAVEAAQRIRQQRPSPQILMEVLSQALEAHPSIELDRFQWESGAAPPVPGDGGRPERALSQHAQIGYIEARVSPFDGDYRAMLEKIESFAESLRKNPYVTQVSTVALPLNVAPDSSLAGTTAEGAGAPAVASFKLKLVLRQHQ